MKTFIILLITGSALLCLQANGRRFMISEETKKDEANNQLIHDTQMRLDGGKNGATEINPNKNNPGKLSTYGKNPIGGSVPKVDEKETSGDTNEENNSSDNGKNDAYGSYDNPDGSSADSHHSFHDDTTASPSLSKHSQIHGNPAGKSTDTTHH
ncbi:hypothetical protein Vadar_026255 [Vaccinium darrowii]|uniref:Uncharacterized protein n=1 Tax=Vaccinium darrowii TaxID=229202 RepID=A0ACB7X4P1_9ERIC|nr:hypothetical protein Vadar_026255 [Vaccinium darrowii]